MKRILIPFILALGIHWLLLAADFKWLKKKVSRRPRFRAVSISLAAVPVKRPDPKPVMKQPAPPQKKMNTEILKPPPEPKPPKKQNIPPKKVFKPIVQPKKENAPIKTVQRPAPASPEPPYPQKQPEQIAAPPSPAPSIPEKVTNQPVMSAIKTDAVAAPPPAIQEAKPLYQQNPKPKYPRVATKRGYQGTVYLDVLVNRNGSVDDLRVSTSSGYAILDKAAMNSVRDWLFVPGKRGDETADMWVVIPVRFQLK